MRNYLLLLLLVTSFLAGVQSPAFAVDEKLITENTLLRAEYDLARKGQVYLFLNLDKKLFEVRSSGMTVTTIPVVEVRPWGPLPQPGLHIVSDKDRVPEREKIKIPPPGGDTAPAKPATPPPPADPNAPPAAKKFDIQATEVTDMPTSYSLWLEGGGVLAVRSFSAATNWKEKLQQRFERTLWKLDHARQSISHHLKKEPYTELMLILTPQDAQRLYWALPVGSALLIPSAHP